MKELMNVVMLPSEEAKMNQLVLTTIGKKELGTINNPDFVLNYTKGNKNYYGITQHLYVTDDSEMNEDSYCYHVTTNIIFRVKDKLYPNFLKNINGSDDYKNVVATTNPELWNFNPQFNKGWSEIARLRQDFIQAYIREYNAGTPITEIYVEVIRYGSGHTTDGTNIEISSNTTPKLRADGTIIISPVERIKLTNSDVEHLTWIYKRLIHVHKENPHYDYMKRFASILNLKD